VCNEWCVLECSRCKCDECDCTGECVMSGTCWSAAGASVMSVTAPVSV